jgi:hypothetical protein
MSPLTGLNGLSALGSHGLRRGLHDLARFAGLWRSWRGPLLARTHRTAYRQPTTSNRLPTTG